DGPETWIVHLGMSGRILVALPAAEREPLGAFHHAVAARTTHDHVVVATEAGAVVTYNDARRFGAMDLWPSGEIDRHPWLARLGPEPLGNAFSGPVLAEALRRKATSIKAALMDQRVVAGLGNIYVSEALWRAGIHPGRVAGTIAAARLERLAEAVVETLEQAIAAGGSSLRDYRQTDGELGYFQHGFRVYDREGAPCPRAGCRGTIGRRVQAGRSSFYCPRCQR
ncbi:MAG TPA: bifunctional DNA-formamidopyrimidine glycosylase/DNA-(apurinic or apyrimidinic site) lyase, partial [Thermohalobaculum sp.]|nr:bifunctional DNA-formamidopyrimidine glycosylase/DNA-(apurinic or apyrimidinic site) lyase [Thermohalobaculum sp.]